MPRVGASLGSAMSEQLETVPVGSGAVTRRAAVQRVCVFAGASPGSDPRFLQAARGTGQALARRGAGLVFGGAGIGLMGAVADGALEESGEVIGVIPEHLVDHGVAHQELGRLEVVAGMHERKARMSQLADGYLALPGGLGTLEELFEAWTWAQLGLHRRPCALLNVNGFFDPLLAFVDQAVASGFLAPEDLARVLVDDDPERLVEALLSVRALPAAAAGPYVPASRTAVGWASVGGRDDGIRLELVDGAGCTIGTAGKLAAHQPPGQLHRAFSVFLFDSRGRMLLQRRAAGKYHWPGVWSNSCCGHPLPGEPPLMAAARRTVQELGRSPVLLQEAGTVTYRFGDPESRLVEWEHNHLFLGTVHAPLHPDPDEVGATVFVDPAELARLRDREAFSGWFPTVLAAALPAIGEAHPGWRAAADQDRR